MRLGLKVVLSVHGVTVWAKTHPKTTVLLTTALIAATPLIFYAMLKSQSKTGLFLKVFLLELNTVMIFTSFLSVLL